MTLSAYCAFRDSNSLVLLTYPSVCVSQVLTRLSSRPTSEQCVGGLSMSINIALAFRWETPGVNSYGMNRSGRIA
ncbi:Hypothetical protein BN117_0483 [Bordetella parapertussis Bpp5]|uniref:Uncharacterized protein n=1 Tax=Bordetella parapertussis (strain Bpp5) TaxID=1208660 RepID=K0MDI1_BORPB|nr:Hypothetical protein BN117_0483 [Bordetella parapertussis Bpp5]